MEYDQKCIEFKDSLNEYIDERKRQKNIYKRFWNESKWYYNYAYEICLDKFDHYFVSSKLDVSKLIAKYKINCWKCADELMEMNNFFK